MTTPTTPKTPSLFTDALNALDCLLGRREDAAAAHQTVSREEIAPILEEGKSLLPGLRTLRRQHEEPTKAILGRLHDPRLVGAYPTLRPRIDLASLYARDILAALRSTTDELDRLPALAAEITGLEVNAAAKVARLRGIVANARAVPAAVDAYAGWLADQLARIEAEASTLTPRVLETPRPPRGVGLDAVDLGDAA